MRLIRRRLIVLGLVVMACQLAGTAATPFVLCEMAAGEASGGDEAVCTCPLGAQADCPLHKHQKPVSPSGRSSENRWCTGCGDASTMALTSVVVWSGPLVERHQAPAPQGASRSVLQVFTGLPHVASPPVSPPPRG